MATHPAPQQPRIWVSPKIAQHGPTSFRVSFTVNGAGKCRITSTLEQARQIQERLKSGVIPDSKRQVPILSPAELEERRADDHYEEKHCKENEDTDKLWKLRACRICGKCLANLGPTTARGHLLSDHHGMTLVQYRDYCQERGWGTPSVLSPAMLKKLLERAHRKAQEHPEKITEERARAGANFVIKYNSDPAFRARRLETNRRVRDKKLSQKFDDRLLQCPYCPHRFRTLRKHIRDVHPEVAQQWAPTLPLIVPELGAQHFQRLENGKAKKKTAQEQKLAKAERILANVGRDAEDEVWARADELYSSGLKWNVIKDRCDQEFSFERSVKAYQEGRKRYLRRQKPTK